MVVLSNKKSPMANRFYLLMALLLANTVRAGQVSGSTLNPVTAPDIRTQQPVTLFDAPKPTMLSFFEPECSWCFKQIKALNKLQQSCELKLNITLVGINGNKQQLRKFLQTTRNQLPAIQHQAKLRQQLGKITATPTHVFFDRHHQFISKQSGFINDQKLTEIISPDCKPQ